MALSPEQLKAAGACFEKPFLVRQVETHLVFGPLSRHLPTLYLFVPPLYVFILMVIWLAPSSQQFNKEIRIFLLVGALVSLPGILLSMRIFKAYTLRQQAIVGWIAIKPALGFVALMLVLVGGIVGFVRHLPDAWPNLFLGLIWIPGLEFVPKITSHQAYVTLARLILTLPCVYFGIKSGNWHW
jgi:hypothetical protein